MAIMQMAFILKSTTQRSIAYKLSGTATTNAIYAFNYQPNGKRPLCADILNVIKLLLTLAIIVFAKHYKK